jgi:hypothetical protein
MTVQKPAADYFKDEPFLSISGALGPATGDKDFLAYSTHEKLKLLVEKTFNRPISFRFVFGRIGEGKTWTLSWLWRRFKEPGEGSEKCLVLGITRLQPGASLERSLIEQVLASLLRFEPELLTKAARNPKSSKDLQTVAVYWKEPDSRDVMIGRGGSARVRKVPRLSGLNMTRHTDLQMLFVSMLEAAALQGYERVLILIDELEGPILSGSKKGISLFADFLRDLQDTLQQPSVRCAHVQFILSGTSNVSEVFGTESKLVERTMDSTGVVGAFLRRAEPSFNLEPPSKEDLVRLTNFRIEVHRTKTVPGKPPKPFQEDAILGAWKYSTNNLGIFSNVLERMYELAVDTDDPEVTLHHLELARKAGF